MLHHWERDSAEVITLGASGTLNIAAAALKDVVIAKATLTGGATFNAPTGGREGQRVVYLFTASGASRTLTQDAAIKGAALLDVASAGAGVVANNATRMIQLMFVNSAWVKVLEIQYT
ncbi:MAG: hypothetical protein EB117_17905 [Betaproteobacteria bacterium]|nr:hypothetical protein [Betaproteobacteria bacterium]